MYDRCPSVVNNCKFYAKNMGPEAFHQVPDILKAINKKSIMFSSVFLPLIP